MRIALVCNQFPLPSETFIVRQIAGLLALGHDVQIFSGRPSASDAMPPEVSRLGLITRTHYFQPAPLSTWKKPIRVGIELCRTAIRRPRSLGNALGALSVIGRPPLVKPFLDAQAFLRAGEFDVALCHFGQSGLRAAHAMQFALRGVPLVVIFHGSDLSSYVAREGNRAYDSLFTVVDLCLPVSQRWAQRLVQLGCDPARISVHHMGALVHDLTYRPRQPSADGIVRLLSVSRLVEKKGHAFAMRALARARPHFQRPFRYDIAGDGPLLTELTALVTSLGLSEHVRMLGWKNTVEVAELMQASHVFVSTSVTAASGDEEGIPVAIMEAMALGMPVIASRHSGIPELVEDGVTGLLAAEHNEEELASALVQMVNEPERWPAFGQRGRAKVEAEFDQRRLDSELAALLGEIAAHTPRREMPAGS